MSTGRFGAASALLNDKFVLVAGGHTNINKSKATNSAEMLDIANNVWI